MTRKPRQPCGTDGAYQRHLVAGETPCQPCLVAHQVRQRELWAKYTLDMRRRTPKGRATERLRRNHLDEYEQLLAEEDPQIPAGSPPDGPTETEGAQQ